MQTSLKSWTLAIALGSAWPVVAFSGSEGDAAANAGILSAATLVEAIRGAEIAHRGRIMQGDASANFADGYIFAIAERAALDGVWCGLGDIAPNEIVSRVFEHLQNASSPDEDPAATAVTAILVDLGPCDQKG
ncbi:hypothetical protein ACG74X_14280 [Marivita sp. S0852]|uniref:hypothetical protein n=1 Tax=Marivita sp. S0852 TaxID=3373893 RepID=UPI003981C4B6